jgi:hypothetical protein
VGGKDRKLEKMGSEELHKLDSSPDILVVIKIRKVTILGHSASK